MPDIKTRVKDSLKSLPAALPAAGARMKDTAIKTRQKAEETQNIRQHNPSEYAVDKVTESANQTAQKVIFQVQRFAKSRLKIRRRGRATEVSESPELEQPGQITGRQSPPGEKDQKTRSVSTKKHLETEKAGSASTGDAESASLMRSKKDNAPVGRGGGKNGLTDKADSSLSLRVRYPDKKTIKQPEYAKGKNIRLKSHSVKHIPRNLQSVQHTSKTAIKTAERTMKQAKKTAKATAKASQRSLEITRKAAKESKKSAKRITKALKATVKAAIKAIKALIVFLAAGGWMVVLAVVIIGAAALLFSSVFGIFFSAGDNGTGLTMPEAVTQINQEYEDRLQEIGNSNSHDVLDVFGSKAVWKEVLAVYAVRTNTDPDDPQEVATINEQKLNLLRSVFWDMNVISHRSEKKEVTEVITEDDGKGNITEREVTTTKTTLFITVTHLTADEAAEKYWFSSSQKLQLQELLSPEYDSLWNAILYGIKNGSGSGDIVEVALSQVGNVGGQPYWSWYGFSGRVEWCACFVSWCANECGYIEAGIIPKFAACTSQGMPWFQNRGQWQGRGYEPSPGDIIFFDWDVSGDADHVGIVEKCENGVVYTIEGNSNDMCRRNSYSVNSPVIRGYGVPAY